MLVVPGYFSTLHDICYGTNKYEVIQCGLAINIMFVTRRYKI